jgi:NAD(P)-dependent dehydrogenase (short-subunit alcohol dehydrogenase family)
MPPKPVHLFPPSNAPRTWLITAAPSPIGLRLARALLDHGDNVVLGVSTAELQKLKNARLNVKSAAVDLGARLQPFASFINIEAVEKGWRDRTRVVALDGRCGSVCLPPCSVLLAISVSIYLVGLCKC